MDVRLILAAALLSATMGAGAAAQSPDATASASATLDATAVATAPDATALMRAAYDNWRADSSRSVVTMTVHRPDWERSMTMSGWTRGDDDALARFTAPASDAGNAVLTLGDETWVFNPKLNQVIRLPASMMAQSWMGSDFSYDDLSKTNDLLTEYSHRIIGTEEQDGHKVYTIEATPNPGAPVVWGKQELKVRDDGVILGETFFDQDMQPVRAMTADKVAAIGGRDYPVVITMRPADKPDEWTRLETTKAEFNVSLPGYIFTLSNLQNPRE